MTGLSTPTLLTSDYFLNQRVTGQEKSRWGWIDNSSLATKKPVKKLKLVAVC